MTLIACVFATLANVSVSVLVTFITRSIETQNATTHAVNAALKAVSLLRRDRLPPVLPGDKDDLVQVVDPHGRVGATTPGLAGKPPIATFRPPSDQREVRTLCPPAGLKGCMIVVAFSSSEPDGGWVVYSARAAPPWYASLPGLLFLIGQSLVLISLTTLLASRSVARTLAPVDAIRSELERITATDLGRRVPLPGDRDEIRRLAETVNATLDRLEAAYEQLRRFTSDASHDLRSPITAMRTQLEEALLYPQDTDWPRMTEAVLDALERLQAIVTDLLSLARLDAGAPLRRDSVDLGELVRAELERRTSRLKIVQALEEGVFAQVDRLRFTRLLTNLLDNAERHATSQITVVVRAEGNTAVCEVIDDGAGIAVEQREVVFERFTRLDASRTRDAGGTGLGLAIARQIAEAHNGTLTIEDSDRGARFVLRLPLSQAPARP